MSEPDLAVAVTERAIAASPETVYAEWLDAEALADWMCPRPARAIAVEVDPVVGGAFRFDIEENGARFQVTGRYVTLDPPHELVFSWSCSTWPDPDRESIVTVTFRAIGADATLMTIRHALLPPGLAARHRDGWDLIAAQLDASLGRRPEADAEVTPTGSRGDRGRAR